MTLCARPARALGTPHSWFSPASYPGGRLESFTSRLEAGFLGRNLMPSRELPAFRSSRGDLVPGDPLAFRRVAGGDHLAAVGHPGVPCACPPGPGPTSGHPEGKPRVGGAGRGGEGRRGLCSSPMWHQKGRLRAQQRPAPQARLLAPGAHAPLQGLWLPGPPRRGLWPCLLTQPRWAQPQGGRGGESARCPLPAARCRRPPAGPALPSP